MPGRFVRHETASRGRAREWVGKVGGGELLAADPRVGQVRIEGDGALTISDLGNGTGRITGGCGQPYQVTDGTNVYPVDRNGFFTWPPGALMRAVDRCGTVISKDRNCLGSWLGRVSCLTPNGLTLILCEGSYRIAYTGVGGSQYDPVAGWLMRNFNALWGYLGWKLQINGGAIQDFPFVTGTYASEAAAASANAGLGLNVTLPAPGSARIFYYDTGDLANYANNADTSGGCEFSVVRL